MHSIDVDVSFTEISVGTEYGAVAGSFRSMGKLSGQG
jgi:hypothetical protein